MGLPSRAEVRDADEWWAALTDERRISTHRWLTGQGKRPPPSQPEALIEMDGEIAEDAKQ